MRSPGGGEEVGLPGRVDQAHLLVGGGEEDELGGSSTPGPHAFGGDPGDPDLLGQNLGDGLGPALTLSRAQTGFGDEVQDPATDLDQRGPRPGLHPREGLFVVEAPVFDYGRSISLAGIWPLLLDSDGHLN